MISLYYMSFCDVTRPTGQQFLGATLVEAAGPTEAHVEATLRGLNPGGEIALVHIEVDSLDALPGRGRSYLNRFVPREEVMADMPEPVNPSYADLEDIRSATIGQCCNPPVRQ